MEPKKIIILDIYENGAYDVQQELKIAYGNALNLQIEICSITHKKALENVFARYHPQIIINAAAHKHVPLMEHNCVEKPSIIMCSVQEIWLNFVKNIMQNVS